MISDGYHGRLEIALPNLSERESKKNQFGKYGLRAYLGRYNVNIAKTSFSFLADKLGDKLVPDPHSPEGVIPEYPSRADFFAGTNL